MEKVCLGNISDLVGAVLTLVTVLTISPSCGGTLVSGAGVPLYSASEGSSHVILA